MIIKFQRVVNGVLEGAPVFISTADHVIQPLFTEADIRAIERAWNIGGPDLGVVIAPPGINRAQKHRFSQEGWAEARRKASEAAPSSILLPDEGRAPNIILPGD